MWSSLTDRRRRRTKTNSMANTAACAVCCCRCWSDWPLLSLSVPLPNERLFADIALSSPSPRPSQQQQTSCSSWRTDDVSSGKGNGDQHTTVFAPPLSQRKAAGEQRSRARARTDASPPNAVQCTELADTQMGRPRCSRFHYYRDAAAIVYCRRKLAG